MSTVKLFGFFFECYHLICYKDLLFTQPYMGLPSFINNTINVPYFAVLWHEITFKFSNCNCFNNNYWRMNGVQFLVGLSSYWYGGIVYKYQHIASQQLYKLLTTIQEKFVHHNNVHFKSKITIYWWYTHHDNMDFCWWVEKYLRVGWAKLKT